MPEEFKIRHDLLKPRPRPLERAKSVFLGATLIAKSQVWFRSHVEEESPARDFRSGAKPSLCNFAV
jgi:hypothetical protein